MSRTKVKYFKKSDRHSYFVDKLKLNHWFLVDSELIPFKGNFFYIRDLRMRVTLKKEGLKTRVIFCSYHNPNRTIRSWGMSNFELSRTGSEFSNNDNFIPFNLRHKFIETGYSLRKIRQKAADFIFNEFHIIQEEVRKRIWGELYSKYLFIGINSEHSIGEIEICYDVESIAPFEFAKENNLKERFNRAANKSSLCLFNEDGNARFADSDIGISGVRGAVNHGRPYIEALLNDGSKLKVYTKEIAKCTVLNRIERKLGKDQIQKYGTNTFSSKIEFSGLINQIANQTYKLISPILNTPISFDDENLNRVILEFCKVNYGKHADDAFKDFTSGGRFVGTGKNGNSKTAVKHKTLKICREGGPIRQARRGRYVLDLHKLKSP